MHETVHYSKAIILHRNHLIIKTLNPSCKFPRGHNCILPHFLPHSSALSPSSWPLLCFHVVRGQRANTINHRAHLSSSCLFSNRVINAGKSMLNEDQASCEKLFVKKPSGKHRNSTLLEDNGGVGEGQQGRSRAVRLVAPNNQR